MPKFSVILPCYNCAETIEGTLRSLLLQTVTDWEAICVDDGSTDRTAETLRFIAARDPRIRLIHQANAGPSRARNAAARVARGQYLAFLDADDTWLPGKLASVSTIFSEAPEARAAFGRIAFLSPGAASPATTSSVRPGLARLPDFLGENPVCTLSNLTVARDAFLETGGFDESMRFSEDLEWIIRATAHGMPVHASEDLHVHYLTSEHGLSADLLAMHAGWKRAVAAAGPAVSRPELFAAEAIHLRYLARRALRTGAAARVALLLCLKGMSLAPKAFLGDQHRGPMTLLGCLLSPMLPVFFRRRLFA